MGNDSIVTRDGSVDWNGHPAIRRKTGGWFPGILLLGGVPYIVFNNSSELVMKMISHKHGFIYIMSL